MLRLVAIHQLVLSLIAGPLLCCCTTARLGRDVRSDSQAATAGDHSRTQTCCGHGRPPTDDGPPKPVGPDKCPCKSGPPTAVAVPEQAVSAADVLTQLAPGLATLAPNGTLHGPALTGGRTTSFAPRASTLSADDLLYAHHNLRC